MTAGAGQFLRFCIVGTIGFAVDGGLTLLLSQFAGVDPLPARAVAFLVAASVTWLLNRSYTFRSAAGRSSWLAYLLCTAVGAFINLGIYSAWLAWAGEGGARILAGVAFGSAAALGFNFLVSRHVVFRAASPTA